MSPIDTERVERLITRIRRDFAEAEERGYGGAHYELGALKFSARAVLSGDPADMDHLRALLHVLDEEHGRKIAPASPASQSDPPTAPPHGCAGTDPRDHSPRPRPPEATGDHGMAPAGGGVLDGEVRP